MHYGFDISFFEDMMYMMIEDEYDVCIIADVIDNLAVIVIIVMLYSRYWQLVHE